MKKVIAINAGPRKGWNADQLIKEAAKGTEAASFRALYERLVFQSLTYNRENPCCNEHKIPVLLIMTSNCAEEAYDAAGYTAVLESYRNTLSTFVGTTSILTCGAPIDSGMIAGGNHKDFGFERRTPRRGVPTKNLGEGLADTPEGCPYKKPGGKA